MRFTFLGTGTSGGVPMVSCQCEVCQSLDFRDKRLRSSMLIKHQEKNYLIDCGPDFRQQALRTGLNDLEAILFTHQHRDHTGGLDDIRPLNYLHGKKRIDLYAKKEVLEQLKQEYHYAFDDKAYSGVPLLNLHQINANDSFKVNQLKIEPIEVMHHKLKILGFKLGKLAYITDANFIDVDQKNKLKGLEILVLNALQKTDHI